MQSHIVRHSDHITPRLPSMKRPSRSSLTVDAQESCAQFGNECPLRVSSAGNTLFFGTVQLLAGATKFHTRGKECATMLSSKTRPTTNLINGRMKTQTMNNNCRFRARVKDRGVWFH